MENYKQMKKIFILFNLILINSFCVFSQTEAEHNDKSKGILEKVSNTYQKNQTTKFTFMLTINSEDINETQQGYALLKEEKFFYKTEEREVICDGNTVWTYLPEDNECYIDLLEDLENTINPNEIFTVWKDGFKFQYIGEKTLNNELVHQIKMFPKNPEKSKYHTLLMEISETNSTIKQVIIKSKDGVTVKFKILNLTANPTLEDSIFKWNSSNHPNVDEIDNR
jgi:outer membrane lipoprotein-sorting protein